MKDNNSLGLYVNQFSKPVGKAFKKKSDHKRTNNVLYFNFAKRNKIYLKQNAFTSGFDKTNSIIGSNNKGPTLSKALEGHAEKLCNIPVNENMKNSFPRKRKLDGSSDTKIKNSKVPKTSIESSLSKTEPGKGLKAVNKVKLDITNDTELKAKKKRKKNKKKRKATEDGNDGVSEYKPVLIVKKPKDISANWKNLKSVIAKQDRELALEKKLNQDSQKKWKHDNNKGNIEKYVSKNEKTVSRNKKPLSKNEKSCSRNEKSLSKKRERMNLNIMMEEQKRQIEKYEKSLKNDSLRKQRQEEKTDIWFDNVDPILLGEEYSLGEEDVAVDTPKKESREKGIDDQNTQAADVGDGKAVAIDCEMVGIGSDGRESMLARVSIVDQYCKVVYDKYVKPQEPVVDYRTEFSGIRPEDIKNGHDFKTTQAEVAEILNGKILVGHSVDNDLRVLRLQHPRSRIRDTSKYKPFKTMFGGFTPKLKILTKKILGADIQSGEHDSVQDAQATMRIYTVHRKQWDKMKKKVFDKSKKKTKKGETSETQS